MKPTLSPVRPGCGSCDNCRYLRIERPGFVTCLIAPGPGGASKWIKAWDDIQAKRPCLARVSYFLDDNEVSVTDLMRDYPANEQLQAAIALLKPGQIAFIFSPEGVYELRAEVAPQAYWRAA